MGAVLFAMIGPTVVFGLFALLAVADGEPLPAAEQQETATGERAGRPARPRRQPATVPLASASNAATSPSGV